MCIGVLQSVTERPVVLFTPHSNQLTFPPGKQNTEFVDFVIANQATNIWKINENTTKSIETSTDKMSTFFHTFTDKLLAFFTRLRIKCRRFSHVYG